MTISTLHDTWNWTKNASTSRESLETRRTNISVSRNSHVGQFWALLMVFGSPEGHARCSTRGIREICLEWHSRGTVHFHVCISETRLCVGRIQSYILGSMIQFIIIPVFLLCFFNNILQRQFKCWMGVPVVIQYQIKHTTLYVDKHTAKQFKPHTFLGKKLSGWKNNCPGLFVLYAYMLGLWISSNYTSLWSVWPKLVRP